MRFVMTWALAACALPAAALADLADQYAAVYRALGPALNQNDPERDLTTTEAMIRDLAGRWVNIGALAAGAAQLQTDLMPRLCERSGSDLVPLEPFAFEVVHTSKAGTQRTRFTYMGRAVFQRSTLPSEVLTRMLGDTQDSARPDAVATLLRNSSAQGPVTVLHPSPDVLVFLSAGDIAEIWGRCAVP